jgi:site-specific recombinase XerD
VLISQQFMTRNHGSYDFLSGKILIAIPLSFGQLGTMPRRIRFKPSFSTALNRWVLNIPASLSKTGRRARLFFEDKESAQAAATRLRMRHSKFATSLRSLDPLRLAEAQSVYSLLDAQKRPYSLPAIVRQWIDLQEAKSRSVSLIALFEAYLASKPHLSAGHQSRIGYVQHRFEGSGKVATRSVSEIEPSDLAPVLAEMKGGTRNKYLRILHAVFNYAVKHDWTKTNPVDKLDFAVMPKRSIRIFSNQQIEDMLRYSAEYSIDMLPYFALGAFAGLRVGSGELSELRWDDIKWEEKTIVVRPEISKTHQRRLIPLFDATNAWLTLYLERTKLTSRRIITIPYGTLRKLSKRIFEWVSPGNRWIAAGLRHSFCSAMLNAEKGIDATCLAMGYTGSPTILFGHYYAATSKADALAYWEIKP